MSIVWYNGRDDEFKKKIVWSLGVIVLSALVFWLGVGFLSQKINAEGNSILSKRSALFSLTNAAENLSSLKQLAPQVDAYQKKIDILLPVQDQLLNFPAFISQLADASQLKLSFNYIAGGEIGPVGSTPGSLSFAFKAAGPLQNIQDFMSTVEEKNAAYWIGIDSYDLVKSTDGYSLEGQGKVFFVQ